LFLTRCLFPPRLISAQLSSSHGFVLTRAVCLQEEAGDTSRDNGLGQEAAGQVKSEPGEAAAETQPAEGWEAGMDDNFLLGEDQEEEPKSAAK